MQLLIAVVVLVNVGNAVCYIHVGQCAVFCRKLVQWLDLQEQQPVCSSMTKTQMLDVCSDSASTCNEWLSAHVLNATVVSGVEYDWCPCR